MSKRLYEKSQKLMRLLNLTRAEYKVYSKWKKAYDLLPVELQQEVTAMLDDSDDSCEFCLERVGGRGCDGLEDAEAEEQP